ncbi:MAG TPA: hypothetical protein VNT75_15840 [Symbiobacteriaceae bacterium]|nr:hypothetical protein [Symbiobacteriaceae bacterium]
MASLLSVRLFELVCLIMWTVSFLWVRRTKNPVFAGLFWASTALMIFDWVFKSEWFLNVSYDPRFFAILQIDGVRHPLALAMNYGLFFGMPSLILMANRAAVDRRFGGWTYLLVFLFGAVLDAAFEIPMGGLGLWTYHQAPQYLLGGVPWSNLWYSGMMMTATYGAGRLALRWTESPALGSSAGARMAGAALSDRETWWRSFATGFAFSVAAIYLCFSVQLYFWYGLVQPSYH